MPRMMRVLYVNWAQYIIILYSTGVKCIYMILRATTVGATNYCHHRDDFKRLLAYLLSRCMLVTETLHNPTDCKTQDLVNILSAKLH